MNKHGGRSKGSGRPKTFSGLKAEVSREAVARAVRREMKIIIDTLLEKALAGDMKAMKILLYRAWGPAKCGNCRPKHEN